MKDYPIHMRSLFLREHKTTASLQMTNGFDKLRCVVKIQKINPFDFQINLTDIEKRNKISHAVAQKSNHNWILSSIDIVNGTNKKSYCLLN